MTIAERAARRLEAVVAEAYRCTDPNCCSDEDCREIARAHLLDAGLREAVEALERAREAMTWCGGSSDFSPEGKAHEGWEKLVRPAILAVNDAIDLIAEGWQPP